ncbi:TRAP transporter small permease [Neisseria leonii]|uniref:TRAP transporter small permease protein n=1 Tax=Neisseria leonii TaxID=2995413 RepID=A0A9X4IBN3_9NEIS|nr:TRAP transporter small permease [Neisseria sp. 51.81]MDD9328569.1 TRAP transporter small permease [Neisseria sp. 51.81]
MSADTEKIPQDAPGRLLWIWSKWSALGGVVILVLVCLISTVSVLGRWLFSAPLKGDVELVQIGCALAISAFLPYAQMKNAHVIVDFFTVKAPEAVRRILDAAAALILAAIGFVLAWRSYFGAVGAFKSKSATMILGWPEWWSHISIAPGFFLLGLAALYTAWHVIRPHNQSSSEAS